ncbi:hypothetical protein GCM10027592_38800 [Spirosoma flavus]
MAKSNLKWLSDFEYRYKPSKSFLTLMDKELRSEYSKLMNKEFDVRFLFIEFQDDLSYVEQTGEALLKASPRLVANFAGEAVISWKHKYLKKLVLPSDEISQDDVHFLWLQLILPSLLPTPKKPVDLAKKLGLYLNYPFVDYIDTASLDVEFYVQVQDSSVIEQLTNRIETLRSNWNHQADLDQSRRKGYIHNFYPHGHKGEYFVFRMDTGSAAGEALKLVLNELNNPRWGIQKVELH